MSKKNNSFSFENDPGKMSDKNDAEFTFSDIPVLGSEKKKEAFSVNQVPDKEKLDPSLASFEALLQEQPKENDLEKTSEDVTPTDSLDLNGTNLNVQRVIDARNAKKKKKMLLMVVAFMVTIAFIALISTLLYSTFFSNKKPKKKDTATADKHVDKEKIKEKKIAGMLANAKSLLNEGKTERALELYKNIIRIAPNKSEAHIGSGKCYESFTKLDEAKISYQKAIDSGPKVYDPYYLLANIFIEEGQLDKAISTLELGKSKFSENTKILCLLGNSYYERGDFPKAIENYKQIPKSELKKESIIKFASILKNESKDDAKKLYQFGGKKFKDFKFFLKAVECTSTNEDKIQIITEAVNLLKDSDLENIDEIKYLLAKSLSDNKEGAKAVTVLKDINISKLDKEYCSKLIHIAIRSELSDLKGYIFKILESHPNDITIQKEVQTELLSYLPPDKVLSIYGDWWIKNRISPIANYLYGKAFNFRNSPSSKKYFEKAFILKPDFFEAILELAKIKIREKDYRTAENYLKKAIQIKNHDKEANRLLATLKIKRGKGTEAIRDYSIFLSKIKMPISQKASDLFDLSILLPTSNYAKNFLNQIKANPIMLDEYREKNAQMKLIFDEASDSDFIGSKTKKLQKYYVLYLLSKGKYLKAMEISNLSINKDEHPAFWKIYILRKKNIASWKNNAELFLENKKNTAQLFKTFIISVWLKKITLEEAEKNINKLSPDSQGLFYALLAEEYRKEHNTRKETLSLIRAGKCEKSIYSGVIKHIDRSNIIKR